MKQVKENARRLNQSGFLTEKGRPYKWEFQCAHCKNWFPERYEVDGKWRAAVEIDHVVPAGSFNCYEDVVPFIKRLTEESLEAYQLLCRECHRAKTNKEKSE